MEVSWSELSQAFLASAKRLASCPLL